jgi:YHS domain-containing protein
METVLYFLLFGAVIFFMMRFGCGSHVAGHGHGHGRSRRQGSEGRSTGGARWTPPEKDTDPVCGMTVATAGARSAVHDGNVYYFCSADCRDKFEAAPGTYVKAGSASSQSREHEHGSHQ